MKPSREKTGLRRRSLLGGAVAAALAIILPRRRRKAIDPNRRSTERARWIGHY